MQMTREQDIEAFWELVELNQAKLNSMRSTEDEFWNVMLNALRAISPHLCLELTPPEVEDREMVITPDGHEEAFDIADEVVDLAPIIKDGALLRCDHRKVGTTCSRAEESNSIRRS
jgi:hypothetical protein